MGKSSSSSSCLKIIVCGSDSAENDQLHSSSTEAKTPTNKRGWSFRKKSGRHQVLGNNVSSESTPITDKETPRGVDLGFHAPVKSISADEKPQLPKPIEEISKPIEEISKAVVATDNGGELKTSAVVATSESGAPQAETKVNQDEVSLKEVGNETSAEDKMVDAAVVVENDRNQTVAENKMADDVISENDSNDTSDTSIAGDSSVSKDESIKSDERKISESGMASDDLDANLTVDEPAVIIIQSAMRRFLAQRRMLQLESAVKLQAIIRGHLVRRNAVETLQCIRAIVKFQGFVRAHSSKSLGQKNRPDDAQFSTMKLLQNSFARQLLESTSKPKSLNIRCDPMRPNSSWSWLERWMSVSKSEAPTRVESTVELDNEVREVSLSNSEAAKRLEPGMEPDNDIQEVFFSYSEAATRVEPSVELDNVVQETSMRNAEFSSVIISDSIASKLNMEERENSLINEEKNMTAEVVADVSSSAPPLSTEFTIEQSHLQTQEIAIEDVSSAKIGAITTEDLHTDASSAKIEAIATQDSHTQAESMTVEGNKPDTASEIEEPKLSMKRSAPSDLNDEGKKFVCGSRKASNPAFIAAHSKFEELTTASNPGKATISSHQDVGAESHVESLPSSDESVKKDTKPSDADTSETFDPRIHVARSECGTEISVSSTLDSPDRSDIENAEADREVQFLEQRSFQPVVGEKQDREDGMTSVIQQEEVYGTNSVPVGSIAAEVSHQAEDKLEKNASDVQADFTPASPVTTMDSLPTEENHQENGYDAHLDNESTTAYKSSPEASPISRRMVQESQGTPSSQVSVTDKRNKVDKRGSNRKRSSPSSAKKSPSNPNADSGARSSTENLPKSGKRRNSFGSTKSDNVDQEPRDSSSRITLPSYMQATESARAKANSPRSSPDVHDKEVYSKKRHSLPATGKQGSNIHRSTPPVAQGAKANGSQPSNEKKWQR